MREGKASRWPGVVLLALLGACAHEGPRFKEPEKVWPSPLSLDSATSCVIRALNERGHSDSAIAPNLTHSAHVLVPGRITEVSADQELALTNERYLVRLEKIDDQITRISLFAESPWKKELIRALAPCGTRG